jgi:hypothetical protein
VADLEAMIVVRARFPLGYITYVCCLCMPSFAVWIMNTKCLKEWLNLMLVECYDELLEEAKLDLAVMVAKHGRRVLMGLLRF